MSDLREKARRYATVEQHLKYNFYPPLPTYIIPAVLEAWDKADEGNVWAKVALQNGDELSAFEILEAVEMLDVID